MLVKHGVNVCQKRMDSRRSHVSHWRSAARSAQHKNENWIICPLPTLTDPTNLHTVVTFTVPCALVTLLGMHFDIGNRTLGTAHRAHQIQLNPVGGFVLASDESATV